MAVGVDVVITGVADVVVVGEPDVVLDLDLPTVPPTAPPTTAPITSKANSATRGMNTFLLSPHILLSPLPPDGRGLSWMATTSGRLLFSAVGYSGLMAASGKLLLSVV